tara:strand:+ start:1263 stop:1853 length:591 start_codon:yes stop_codon:yes gene_type:complete
MLLDSLLTGVMVFSSFAMRTANVQPNPDDYELSIGLSHTNYFINRQWERELGGKYMDDLIWVKVEDHVYFKPEYMNKESQGVKYAKLDWRKTFLGATWGFTTRSTDKSLKIYETFASVGLSKKKSYWDKVDVEVTFDGYLPPNENGETELKNFEFEDKFKVSWKLTDKVRLYNLGEISKLQGKQFYKGKVGVEITL